MSRVRRLHPVPLLAGVLVVIVAVQLGNWQLRRAEYKRDLGEQIERQLEAGAEPLASSDVTPPVWSLRTVAGRWKSEAVLFHDNRVLDRRPGYHVLMPLELADGGHVLVNRGWIAAGTERTALPDIVTPDGPIVVRGRVTVPEKDPFSLADSAHDGQRWQFIDLAGYRAWSGLTVGDWVLQQMSDTDDGLVRRWSSPDLGEDKHRGYALQWYSLALLAAGLTAYYVFRSFRKDAA